MRANRKLTSTLTETVPKTTCPPKSVLACVRVCVCVCVRARVGVFFNGGRVGIVIFWCQIQRRVEDPAQNAILK